jgi:hypothetical protein
MLDPESQWTDLRANHIPYLRLTCESSLCPDTPPDSPACMKSLSGCHAVVDEINRPTL